MLSNLLLSTILVSSTPLEQWNKKRINLITTTATFGSLFLITSGLGLLGSEVCESQSCSSSTKNKFMISTIAIAGVFAFTALGAGITLGVHQNRKPKAIMFMNSGELSIRF